MGENEQGGMLRSVVVIGLVALIAAVVIGIVLGMNSNLKNNLKLSMQNVSKAQTNTTIDYDLEMHHGMFDSLEVSSDVLSHGYLNATVSGNTDHNVTSNVTFTHYDSNNKALGILSEMYLDASKLPWIKFSDKSDYIEASVDYEIINPKPLTQVEAQAQGLDTYRGDLNHSGIFIDIRSNTYTWDVNTYHLVTTMTGIDKGTITVKSPKGDDLSDSAFEVAVAAMNMDFDSLKLTNLQISNAKSY